MKIQFSVIIPLYNKAETIGRAIRSVLNQKYSDFELIVVDDGSTDHGADIVRGFHDPRIRLIQQENGGVSKARNTGIEAAKYDYLTFLDADDEYLPLFLYTIYSLILRYPNSSMFACSYWFQFLDGTNKPLIIKGVQKGFVGPLNNYFDIAIFSAPPLWTGAVCIKKKALQKEGGFPLGVTSGEDLLTWVKIYIHHSLIYENIPMAIYHLDAAGEYLPTRIPQKDDLVGKELLRLFQEEPTSGLKKYIAFWHKNRASCFLRLTMRTACLKECIKVLKYYPGYKKIYLYIFLALLPQFLTRKVFTFYWKMN